ncbi:hypothetical protein JXA80_10625 [bacterium]|nr:hypothetical protein [candidate division CSSED10-310 bacterium]
MGLIQSWSGKAVIFLLVSLMNVLPASAEKVTRKDMDVVYQYRQINDGFGNIRLIQISGYVKNRDPRMASRVDISFKLSWQSRSSDVKKLEFINLPPNDIQDFEFEIDLGTQPDVLSSVICTIERIKFSKQREASPLTDNNIVLHDFYTLPRLNEEGKDFLNILKGMCTQHRFEIPLQNEFETTNEYETRLNEAENDHFSRLMDELEKRYGQLLGGQNAVVRFLPRTYRNSIVYLSECSAYFQIPIRFGRYNADRRMFENVSMVPRTFPYPPMTLVPDTLLNLIHKSGMFFLRKDEFFIEREEARIWRSDERFLVLEVTVRNGVVQNGPYFSDFCIVEKIQVKNTQTGRIIREWSIVAE